jgi:hypothetical protein
LKNVEGLKTRNVVMKFRTAEGVMGRGGEGETGRLRGGEGERGRWGEFTELDLFVYLRISLLKT